MVSAGQEPGLSDLFEQQVETKSPVQWYARLTSSQITGRIKHPVLTHMVNSPFVLANVKIQQKLSGWGLVTHFVIETFNCIVLYRQFSQTNYDPKCRSFIIHLDKLE